MPARYLARRLALPSKATIAVSKAMGPTVKVSILAMVTVPNGMGIPPSKSHCDKVHAL
jgi:hypothetical protein